MHILSVDRGYAHQITFSTNILLNIMTSKEQTPERELNLIHLRLYLQEFPKSAYDLAIHFYAKSLELADNYKRLRIDFDNLQQENIRLKSLINHRSPSFIKSDRGAS